MPPKPALRIRLSLMMFGQYFIWAAWFITLGTYMKAGLGFEDIIGLTYATQGLAAMIAPLFIGVIADRWVSAQKLMGCLHLSGAVCLFGASFIEGDRVLFVGAILMSLICYMPTIALSNAVAFNQLSDTGKQFAPIRIFGSIGWIAAGLGLALFSGIGETPWPLRLAAIASVITGLYAFFLPDTPPQSCGKRISLMALFGFDLMKSVRDPRYWLFISCSLLIVIPLSFYYAYVNRFLEDMGAQFSIGGLTLGSSAIQIISQMAEAVGICLIPLLFSRWGGSRIILSGMVMWIISYGLLAGGATSSAHSLMWIIPAILLQGLCYDFFFIAGQLEMENRFEESERSRAQAFHAFVTFGVGNVLGYVLSGIVYAVTVGQGHGRWDLFWLVPVILSLTVGILYAGLGRRISNATANKSDRENAV